MPQVTITAMTFGPYGLARLAGRAVMVPGAAPGDELEVAIESERRDYAIARIVRVLAPGPARRAPPCPFLPRCGGCGWQQLEYPAQLRAKAASIASALGPVIGLRLDPDDLIEPAPEEFGYRSRIRLQASREGRLGFHGYGTNTLVEIDHCMVAMPGMKLPFELARALKPELEELEIVRSSARVVLAAWLRTAPSRAQVQRARRVMRDDGAIQGIVLSGAGARETVGDPEITADLEEGLSLRAGADLFSQVNPAQNRRLVRTVMEMAAPSEGMKLLDLFCGAGNLSLPAARRGALVTGVDSDARAIAAAAHNAARMGLARAQFLALRAAETARFLLRARYQAETVILDPPRSGAAELMAPVLKLRPRAVIYVSCDAATLARDLRALMAGGYRAARVRAFDFFPQTHHAEIAAHLLLT